MNNWYVYVLKGDRYYIGSTNNIERRMKEHMRGKTHTTQRMGEGVAMYGYIVCESMLEARKLERSIKKSGHYERRIEKNKDKITLYATGL